MLQAKVYITLKKTVADPQGLTIKHALESLGYDYVNDTRIGKLITLKFDNDDEKKVKRDLDVMCEKLLANPIIEDYKYEVKQLQ